MTTTLADLITTMTQEELFNQLLALYAAEGFPTTSWQTGDVDRTRTMAISSVLQQISADYIPNITAGGLLALAAALPNRGWLDILAAQNFGVPVNDATNTVGNITLTAGTAGYTVSAGQLTISFPSTGNRYINTTGGTLSASGTLVVTVRAENAGADYNDPSSSTISIVTPALPGVVATNTATTFSTVSHVGAGTGTITPGGSPTAPHQVIVRVDETGASAPVSWSYSLDGSPFISVGIVTTGTDLGGTGINVTLVDGMSGTSFVEDDEYLFNAPGSWITTQGSDEETVIALAQRCRNSLRLQAAIPTNGYYEYLATSTPDVGSQVTQVIVLPDPEINNRVNIIVAGPGGVLPGDTITALQEYIAPRAIGTDTPTVTSPSQTNITYAATITVPAAVLAAAQDAADTAMVNYTSDAGINPTLRIAKVTELIMEIAGAIDVSGVTINGSSSNVVLGSSTSYVVATFLATDFTWITV